VRNTARFSSNDEILFSKYTSDLSESKSLVAQENKFVLCFIVSSGCLDYIVPESAYVENQGGVTKRIQIANVNINEAVCIGKKHVSRVRFFYHMA
jgi:hypothetical protein